MQSDHSNKKQNLTPDWFVHGVLSKLGDMFDRFLGRGWKPSSSLATSELVERMKALLDAEARTDETGHTYVPHNIRLKMQWDKFATDSEGQLQKLEEEFHIAAIDHINDRRFYTYAPLRVEAKADYFTSGVKLFVSYDRIGTDEDHEAAIDVSMPGHPAVETADGGHDPIEAPAPVELTARFELNGEPFSRRFPLEPGTRLSVGRTKENHLAIDDISVSKFHGSLVLNASGGLVVADTGSTNGTFINGERIAYGKAIPLNTGDVVRFGSIDVFLETTKTEVAELNAGKPDEGATKAYKIGEFQFLKPLVEDMDVAGKRSDTGSALMADEEREEQK